MTPLTFSPASLSKPKQAPLTPAQIGIVFSRLNAQLGAKVADLYAGVPPETVRAEWSAALGGFRDEEIMTGLDACRRRIFAPTLGEFLNLCRPALDPEIAWLEAAEGLRARSNGQQGDWSHPAVFRAACAMGFELRGKSFKECRKLWTLVLEREFARGWGKDVPPAPLLIPRMPSAPAKPSGTVLDKINEILGKGKTA